MRQEERYVPLVFTFKIAQNISFVQFYQVAKPERCEEAAQAGKMAGTESCFASDV